MVSKYFKDVIKKGIILRYVDDYLIMTPDIKEIEVFLKRIEEIEDKGFIINRK